MSVTHSGVQVHRENILPWSSLSWSYSGDIYPSGSNSLYWSTGDLNFSDDSVFTIDSGLETFTDTKYLYWDTAYPDIFQFGTASECTGRGKVAIGVAIENLESGQEASLRVFQGPGLNITADNIATNTLSAISANMGTINAGIINGIEINGSTITGGIIQTSADDKRVVIDGGTDRLSFYKTGEATAVLIIDNDLWPSGDNPAIYMKDYSTNDFTFILPSHIQLESRGMTDTCFWSTMRWEGHDGPTYAVLGESLDTAENTYSQDRVAVRGYANITNAANDCIAMGVWGEAYTAGSGLAIGGKFRSTDIATRLEYDATRYVDFRVDSSGYLNIRPTGDRLRLWESAGGANDFVDMYSNVNGALLIDPGGLGTNIVSMNATVGASMLVVSFSDSGTYSGATLSALPGMRVYNTHNDTSTMCGIHFTTGASSLGYAGIYGTREGNNQCSLAFYTEGDPSGSRSEKFKIEQDGALSHMGSEIITVDSEQTGALRTMMPLAYGSNLTITTDDYLQGAGGRDAGHYRLAYDAVLVGITYGSSSAIQLLPGDSCAIEVRYWEGDSDATYSTTTPLTLTNSHNGLYGAAATGLSTAFSAGDRLSIYMNVSGTDPSLDKPQVVLYFISKVV